MNERNIDEFLRGSMVSQGRGQLVTDSLYITSRNASTEIIDVKVIVPNKVVEVKFRSGEKQKAVCDELDSFSLEHAISICVTKQFVGGTGVYNKMIKRGLKVYEDKLKKEELLRQEKKRTEKKREKLIAYKKRKAEKVKEEKIEIQKEAYIRAMEHINTETNKY